MKTSFYFVLWILIYPILGLFNNDFINNLSFASNDFLRQRHKKTTWILA